MVVYLDFTPTKDYPNEVPKMEILDREGLLSDSERSSLMDKILACVS